MEWLKAYVRDTFLRHLYMNTEHIDFHSLKEAGALCENMSKVMSPVIEDFLMINEMPEEAAGSAQSLMVNMKVLAVGGSWLRQMPWESRRILDIQREEQEELCKLLDTIATFVEELAGIFTDQKRKDKFKRALPDWDPMADCIQICTVFRSAIGQLMGHRSDLQA